MLPPVYEDVACAASALLAVAEGRRDALLDRLLREARMARVHRLRRGRIHRLWGDGSLMAEALRREIDRRPLTDPEFRAEVVRVLRALPDQPRMQDRQSETEGSNASRSGSMSSPHSVQ